MLGILNVQSAVNNTHLMKGEEVSILECSCGKMFTIKIVFVNVKR